ncbi:uncharacterized protein BO97DRAFT_464664 [Aspergillus homomorphus CBS 101889]|uniref:Methyltransferase domain-containing protein n=1 Tax=Aspergillus homomorphus (strain CBS 101889) TaxID=1450537 RepID=A0A395HHB9_ASPHC|nr:hypothetical protein BO97DRAFT_464664 [Aspergillus homomorphus CBS 101889]RAL07150.1 hypothetical protein BO97DRAFT_464664 [Aspergillus homomorphus CBS 101889]
MASEAKDQYVFDRSYLDNARINVQHYFICQVFGYHIHPSISTSDLNMRIADVGTGTGIWLTDLAPRLSESVRLDGLDISFDACPPREWLPPNMTLHHWDVKMEVPEYLAGVYDLVSVRHFAFVLQQHELQNALSNLVKLLKPGGYLQWTDVDMTSQRIEKARPDIDGEPQERIMKLFRGNDPRLHSAWVPSLGERFGEVGLTKVEVDQRETPHYIGQRLFESGFLAVEALTRNGRLDERKMQEVQEIFRDSAKVTREGSYAALTRYTVVGQKPVERSQ